MLIAGALLRAAAGDSGEDTSGQVHQAAAFCSISKTETKKKQMWVTNHLHLGAPLRDYWTMICCPWTWLKSVCPCSLGSSAWQWDFGREIFQRTLLMLNVGSTCKSNLEMNLDGFGGKRSHEDSSWHYSQSTQTNGQEESFNCIFINLRGIFH